MSEGQRQVLSIGQIDEFRHLLSVTQIPVPFSDDWDLQIDGAHEFARAIELATIEALAQQAQPVQQFRRRLCTDWYDGHPDHEDGGGPYETRILYTTPPSPQPSVPVVSDEQIESCALAAGFSIEPSTGAIWAVDGCGSTRVDPGLRKFARAILTLRPAVEPMTPEQMRKAAMDEMGKIPALANHHSWKGWPGTWAFATAAVNGITAKAEGGA